MKWIQNKKWNTVHCKDMYLVYPRFKSMMLMIIITIVTYNDLLVWIYRLRESVRLMIFFFSFFHFRFRCHSRYFLFCFLLCLLHSSANLMLILISGSFSFLLLKVLSSQHIRNSVADPNWNEMKWISQTGSACTQFAVSLL